MKVLLAVILFGVQLSRAADLDKASAAYSAKDYVRARELFLVAAENGNAEAQKRLGNMYFDGEGVSKDYGKAMWWFRKSAKQGNVKAQFNLGLMYETARGVPQNYGEAADWYRKAADQGDSYSQVNLGRMYARGNGVPRDFEKAIQLWRKPAEQGVALAQFNMGVQFEKGQGVPQSYSDAFNWYLKAATQGLPEAQFNLAACYYDGKGVKTDLNEALKWFRKAAEQGDADAQRHVDLVSRKIGQTRKNTTKAGEVSLSQVGDYILDYRKAKGVDKLDKLTWLLHIYNVKKLGSDGVGISPALGPLELYRYFSKPKRYRGLFARTNIKQTPIGYGVRVLHPHWEAGKYRFTAKFFTDDATGLSAALQGRHPGGHVTRAYFISSKELPSRRFFEIFGEFVDNQTLTTQYNEKIELPGFTMLAASGFNGFDFEPEIARKQQEIVFDDVQIERVIKNLIAIFSTDQK